MQKLEAAASQLQQVGTQEALLSPLSNFPRCHHPEQQTSSQAKLQLE